MTDWRSTARRYLEIEARFPTGRPEHYYLDGETPVPCVDEESFIRYFEQWERRRVPDNDPWRVGATKVGDASVSTVFLGLDHAFGDGPPILWETMVFGGDLDGEQMRYTSLAAAQEGHVEMVVRVQRAQQPTA